jgi:hypothetical protein
VVVNYSQNVDVRTRGDCRNCGAVVAGDALFCQRCGAPVVRAGSADGNEPADAAESPDRRSPVLVWGARLGLALLVAATAVTVVFAVLVLLFGAFVDS